MNVDAVVLMVVTILSIWGGLIAAIVAFREGSKRVPEETLEQSQIPGDRKGGI